MGKVKKENQILIMLAFFSISVGLWGNFRQLWLEANHFTVTNISNIISFGTFISVIVIVLVEKYINVNKLKSFLTFTLLIKILNMFFLLKLNGSLNNILINISIAVDVITEYIIISSIYPLITTILKNNTIYSKRKLTEYLFRDIGILIGGLIIGRTIMSIVVDYNICLFISMIFLVFSIITNINLKIENTSDIRDKSSDSIIKYIFKSKIQILYSIYTFIGAAAMSTALGLKMLTLTNYFSFSDSFATNYLLIIGLIADIFGILALKFFTPKNDYLTITIKFGIRFIAYIIAFMSNSTLLTLMAITWSLLISTSYENICDGYYVNSVKNEYQLRYTNFRYIIRFLGEAVGVFFCGLMFECGLRYMFGLSAFLMIFQIGLAYYLIYLRKNEVIINE